MTVHRPRKHIPLSVKLKSCLILLGFTDDDRIDWDHCPALGLREFDEIADDYIPAELDPHFLVPRERSAHKAKTNGRKGEKRVTSYGSDVHAMRKVRHTAADEAAFRERMLVKAPGERQSRKSSFPQGRKLQGRGFPKRIERTVERRN